MFIEDVLDGDGVRRYGTAWVDQICTGLGVKPPHEVFALAQVLPTDLADVIRAVSTRLEIDEADAELVHLDAAITDHEALITMALVP